MSEEIKVYFHPLDGKPIDKSWTKQERYTEVCHMCYCQGCSTCGGTGFVKKKEFNTIEKYFK